MQLRAPVRAVLPGIQSLGRPCRLPSPPRLPPRASSQGQLLGIGGRQLQRIQHESGARVEVRDAHGNLNGAHPNPLDPELHALVTASSLVRLLC